MTPIPFAVYVALSVQISGLTWLLVSIASGEVGPIVGGLVFFFIPTFILFSFFRKLLEAKGYSASWALLVLLNLIGLIIIFALPVRRRPVQQGFEVIPEPTRRTQQ